MGEKVTKEVKPNVISQFESKVKEMEYWWDKYSEFVRGVLDDWEKNKDEIKHRIIELTSAIENFKSLAKELDIKHELGLISDSEYNSIKTKYNNELVKYNEELEQLKTSYDKIESSIKRHYKRIMHPIVKSNEEDIKKKLELLDKLFKEGKVKEEVYKRLRKELEDFL